MTKYISILGKPGAGKSTLASSLGVPVVSAGDQARKYLPAKAGRGLFVNQRRVAQLVSREAKKIIGTPVVVLEGTPLSEVSASEYKNNGIHFSLVIYLEIPDSIVQKRLEKRGRETDLKYFKRRLLSFKRVTMKVINNFKQQGILITIDANKDQPKLLRELKRLIKDFLKS